MCDALRGNYGAMHGLNYICWLVKDTKSHFTLGIKAKVQLNLNIPIGAFIDITPKGFILWVKAEKENNLLIYHFIALTWPQGWKRIPINLGGQFVNLGANVTMIKY